MEIEGKARKKRKGDSDHVWEYACVVLSTALFMAEFKDAVKEGDGIRVDSICSYSSKVPVRQICLGSIVPAISEIELTLSPRLQKQFCGEIQEEVLVAT